MAIFAEVADESDVGLVVPPGVAYPFQDGRGGPVVVDSGISPESIVAAVCSKQVINSKEW
jgi:hypothetical protein